MDKFYLVKQKAEGKTENLSSREHYSFEQAKNEAVRLSRQFPEKEFYVLETTTLIKTNLSTEINFFS
jgi:hypothetical protein